MTEKSSSSSVSSSQRALDLSSLSKFDTLQQRRARYPAEHWPTRYLPSKQLGKGHDGLCYLCEDTETHEMVAVKLLNSKRNRKVTEPEIMAGLHHKNIVTLRAHYVINNQNFIVLDYCERGDLCDYVYDHEFLAEAEARKIMVQLVDGVSYLHERGICHRDLKLDNIFIDKNFNIKIGDFGASCRFDQEVKLTYRCGTTQYNAPELVKNQGYFGDEVDCWALGIILYVMLVGKFPFDCETDLQLLWQVLKGIRFPEKPVLSDSVKNLIRLLTEPEPSQRATLAVVLEHPWIVKPNIAAGVGTATSSKLHTTQVPSSDSSESSTTSTTSTAATSTTSTVGVIKTTTVAVSSTTTSTSTSTHDAALNKQTSPPAKGSVAPSPLAASRQH